MAVRRLWPFFIHNLLNGIKCSRQGVFSIIMSNGTWYSFHIFMYNYINEKEKLTAKYSEKRKITQSIVYNSFAFLLEFNHPIMSLLCALLGNILFWRTRRRTNLTHFFCCGSFVIREKGFWKIRDIINFLVITSLSFFSFLA